MEARQTRVFLFHGLQNQHIQYTLAQGFGNNNWYFLWRAVIWPLHFSVFLSSGGVTCGWFVSNISNHVQATPYFLKHISSAPDIPALQTTRLQVPEKVKFLEMLPAHFFIFKLGRSYSPETFKADDTDAYICF